MGTGYTRNDTSNNIADGNIINAADLDGEFDAIESAFGTSGHTHDGTSAEGGPITVLGPVQDFVASATEIKPKTTNTLDIGTSALLFKDLFLDGVATLGSIKIDNAGTIGSASDGDAIAISSGGVVSFSQNTIGKTGSGYVLSLQTSDTTIEATNVLGKIEFSAPDEASGTDAILVGASIEALAEDTFSSSVNSTALVFKTNTTGAATERMRLTSAGDLHFLDNRKAIFGAGSDLQIYHDANNSFIKDSGTGSLYVQADAGVYITNASGSENKAIFTSDGAVNLYHDNALKLATTSTGIDVTGTVTADGLTVNSGTNNIVAKFESSDAGAFIVLEDSGSTNDGNRIAVEGNVMSFATGDSERLRIDSSGNVGIGTSSPSSQLHVSSASNGATAIVEAQGAYNARVRILSGNANSSFLEFADPDDSDVGEIVYEHSSNSMRFNTNATEAMRIDSSGNLLFNGNGVLSVQSSSNNLYLGGGTYQPSQAWIESGSLTAFKTGGTERMRIDSSGNVGIGTSSPNSPLEISNGTENHRVAFGTGEVYLMARNASSYIIQEYIANQHVFTGYGDSSANEAMRINSSGVVTIGDPNASSYGGGLAVATATGSYITVGDTGSGEQLRLEGGSGLGRIGTMSNHDLAIITNGTSNEVARFDTSGNLMIGGTNGNPIGNHVSQVIANGTTGLGVHRDGGVPFKAGTDSDRNVIEVYKQGSLVGSLGSDSGKLVVNSQGSNLVFAVGGTNEVNLDGTQFYPQTDGGLDLGHPSVRWKDLRLSGGVYLGGTGAANKLDDYEEGSWTPVMTGDGGSAGSASTTVYGARYTKVGNLVTVMCYIRWSNIGSYSGNAAISGLPFTSANDGVRVAGNINFLKRVELVDAFNYSGNIVANTSVVQINRISSDQSVKSQAQVSYFNDNLNEIIFSCSYNSA